MGFTRIRKPGCRHRWPAGWSGRSHRCLLFRGHAGNHICECLDEARA